MRRSCVVFFILLAVLSGHGCGSHGDGDKFGIGAPCSANQECVSKICAEGTCVECTGAANCGGRLCVNGRCVACAFDEECQFTLSGQTCESGVCVGPPPTQLPDVTLPGDSILVLDTTSGADIADDGGSDLLQHDAADTGKPCNCKQPANPCLQAECNGLTGECYTVQRAPNTPCDDQNACTENDRCQNGTCKGDSISCVGEKACVVASCAPKSGCVFDNSQCECKTDTDCGGDLCTGVSTCDLATGKCVPGTPTSCSHLDGPCVVGVCNPLAAADKLCEVKSRKEGTVCKADGADASCGSGVCAQSVCKHAPKTAECDGKTCTVGDTCNEAGICTPGKVSCPAQGSCPSGACANDGSCLYPKVSNTNCDNNLCTVNDVCTEAGTCQPGTSKSCPAKNNSCGTGTCISGTGECKWTPQTKECDGDLCTLDDACNDQGQCVSGVAPTCTLADEPCRDGSMSPQCVNGACTYQNAAKECDANVCTVGDQCDAGSCKPGAPVDVATCRSQAEKIAVDNGKHIGCIKSVQCDPQNGCVPVYETGWVADCDNNPCGFKECSKENGCRDYCNNGVCEGGTKTCTDWAAANYDAACIANARCESQQCKADLNSGWVDNCDADLCTFHEADGTITPQQPSRQCDPSKGSCKDYCDAGVCRAEKTLTQTGDCLNWAHTEKGHDAVCMTAQCLPQTGCMVTPKQNTDNCAKNACRNSSCSEQSGIYTCKLGGPTSKCFTAAGQCGVCRWQGSECNYVPTDGNSCDVLNSCVKTAVCSNETCAPQEYYPQGHSCGLGGYGCCNAEGQCWICD